MRTALLVALVTAAGWVPLVSGDTFCSATVPCAIGCCGKFNVCGLGPDYCGPDNCINNCDAKADCNPGDWPAQYVSSQTCPLNVCCSQYGFCGTTAEFCANSTITRPSCDVDSQSLSRVIGYYASGGASRACDSMAPSSFPQGVYTHVYFAFGSIDPETFEVVPATPEDEQLYPQLKALRTRDLGQQFWLSIGGWDFTDSGTPTATTFSDLAAAPITFQNVFFASLTLFMSTWGFSGVDIDWEYPGAADRNGRGEDFVNYPKFLANLKAALNEYKFGLSITLPTSYWYLQHFDLKSIQPSVDWFNYMSYDLHGTWDIGSQWTGAYLNAHTNLTEIKDTIDLLWRNNITASKVNLGLAFYGRSFTIASSACSQPGCDYLSAGDAGDCSAQAGILLGSEINNIISENNLSPVLYTDAAVKTITWNGDQWVSFDDQDTWKIKADFAKSQCLGGVLVWSVDYDDDHNTLSDGLAAALGNPLNIDNSTGLPLTITDSGSQASQSDYCQWTNCGDGCPIGFTTMVRDDEKGQIMLDATQCPTYSNQVQVLCCPTTTNIPTCRWAGFHNSGKCKAGCNSNEAEVGTVSSGCRSGYQSACCTITPSTAPYSACQWTSSCENDNTCPSNYGTFVVGSRNGWGGRPTCDSGESYNYCCSGAVPDAFTTCQWVGHEQTNILPKYCLDACPFGSVRIAEEMIITLGSGDLPGHIEDCIWGNEAYCCSGPSQPSSTAPRGSDPFVYQDASAQEFDYLLQNYLAAPICPGTWDADFSAYTGINARSLLDVRATDNTATLAALLPLLVTWVTSQYPRTDLSNILNYRLTQHNLTGAADLSEMREAFYQNSSWSGTPLYDPESIICDWLCNIASSANEFGNLDAASTALCEYVAPVSATKRYFNDISPRRISLLDSGDRSANGEQPTVSLILGGIADVSDVYNFVIRGIAAKFAILGRLEPALSTMDQRT
jgi:chitinase